jgi:ankyrin repeat protein
VQYFDIRYSIEHSLSPPMKELSPSEQLMHAIANYQAGVVQELLEKGADPNFYYDLPEYRESPQHQPTTPLRLVVFRISDSLLEDSELEKFSEIAKLLLMAGADPKPAMELAEIRYGKYDPTRESGPFMNVLHIIAHALQK